MELSNDDGDDDDDGNNDGEDGAADDDDDHNDDDDGNTNIEITHRWGVAPSRIPFQLVSLMLDGSPPYINMNKQFCQVKIPKIMCELM